MRQELLMPKLGLTMTEGSISEWCVPVGSVYDAGQCLYIVETEKITNEITAERPGTLVEIVVPAGDSVPVGAVVAYVEEGDSSSQIRDSNQTVTSPRAEGGRIVATPLARRLARQRNIDLATVRGTGPGGRIVARDISEGTQAVQSNAQSSAPEVQQAAVAQTTQDVVPSTQSAGTTTNRDASQHYTLIKPSPLQSTAATRLTQGKRDTPHFYLVLEAEVSRLLSLRKELNASRQTQNQSPFTVNHFIVKAVAAAMRQHPEANQVWTDDGILRFGQVGVGVAINTEGGLVAPTVPDAGSCSLSTLAQRIDGVVERAKDGRLGMEDMGHAAITVSNAGMHNVTYMGSIINPGQSMILGVGSVKGVFRPDDSGQPVLRQEMGLVLSADHRVTDGVRALAFLNSVVQFLERPLMLLAE